MKPKFYTPLIVISKCINFENCRFNGEKIRDDFLYNLGKYVIFIPVCPEVSIGLGVPRFPVRLYDDGGIIKMYQAGNEKDLTEKMIQFGENFLINLGNVDGFVMKNRSPSCGVKGVKVYDKKDTHSFSKNKSPGLFVSKINNLFPYYPIEDEGTLKNFKIREDFLTKIFLFAEFREINKNKRMYKLIQFHAKNKFLLMSYNQNLLNELGNIVANRENQKIEDIYKNYQNKLFETLNKIRTKTNIINSLTHISGYFKKTNTPQEKEFFLQSLWVYKEGRIPMSSIIFILKSWAIRDNNKYILSQSFLSPFPQELINLNQSGKNIDI